MTILVFVLPVVVGVLLLVMLLAHPWRTYVEARKLGRNPTALEVSADDRALANAESDARAQLPGFLARLAAPRAGDSEFMVKFRLRGDSTPEQIWAEQLRYDDGRLFGRLANDPLTHGFRFGQELEIPESEIMDWGYRENGIMQGHYSTRVFLERMPEHVRAETRRGFGWNP